MILYIIYMFLVSTMGHAPTLLAMFSHLCVQSFCLCPFHLCLPFYKGLLHGQSAWSHRTRKFFFKNTVIVTAKGLIDDGVCVKVFADFAWTSHCGTFDPAAVAPSEHFGRTLLFAEGLDKVRGSTWDFHGFVWISRKKSNSVEYLVEN